MRHWSRLIIRSSGERLQSFPGGTTYHGHDGVKYYLTQEIEHSDAHHESGEE
jgi:hypothetical protein